MPPVLVAARRGERWVTPGWRYIAIAEVLRTIKGARRRARGPCGLNRDAAGPNEAGRVCDLVEGPQSSFAGEEAIQGRADQGERPCWPCGIALISLEAGSMWIAISTVAIALAAIATTIAARRRGKGRN